MSYDMSMGVAQSNSRLGNVFAVMFGGILLTALIAIFGSGSQAIIGMMNTWMKWPVLLAPLAIVIWMSFRFEQTSKTAMQGCFIAFAALTGLSLSVIIRMYALPGLMGSLVGATVLFLSMAAVGKYTTYDLRKFGPILMCGLIAILIASIVNMFLGSSLFDMIICAVGVLFFMGMTAYDVQTIDDMQTENADDEGKAVIMGALSLYLDFYNLFLFLLRLVGVQVPTKD